MNQDRVCEIVKAVLVFVLDQSLVAFQKLPCLIFTDQTLCWQNYEATALTTANVNTGCSVVVPAVVAKVILKLPVPTAVTCVL